MPCIALVLSFVLYASIIVSLLIYIFRASRQILEFTGAIIL